MKDHWTLAITRSWEELGSRRADTQLRCMYRFGDGDGASPGDNSDSDNEDEGAITGEGEEAIHTSNPIRPSRTLITEDFKRRAIEKQTDGDQ
jgi:hypothetical protein